MKYLVVMSFAGQAIAGYFLLEKDTYKAGLALLISGIGLMFVQVMGLI